MSVLTLDPCPTNCAASLGAVSFDACAPERHFGEISKLYLWVDSATPPFANQAQYDSAAHWNTHLNNSGVAIDDIRELTVIGEKPEPEQTETPISGDRTVIGYKKHTVNMEVDETNETNYNFLLVSECNGKYKANYQTADGIIYGGYKGIDVTLKMNETIPKERTAVVKYVIKMSWSSKHHPFRQISIIAI
jgi:hypothetical protein